MIEAMAFLPLMFWLIYLACRDDTPTKPTGNSFAEMESYIAGLRAGERK